MEILFFIIFIWGYCIYKCISHIYYKKYLPASIALLMLIIAVIFSFWLFPNLLSSLSYALTLICIPLVPIGVMFGIIMLIKKILKEHTNKKYSTLITTVLCITVSSLSFFAAKYFTEYQVQSEENDIYRDIYYKGYTNGKNDMTELIYNHALEVAKNDIYQTAYDKGYLDCKNEIIKTDKEQYNSGYEDGYNDASYIAGFSSLEEAYDVGYEFGSGEGYDEGYDQCLIDHDIY